MIEPQKEPSKADLFVYNSETAPQESLRFLTPKTKEALRIFTDKDIYWGPQPAFEYHKALVQAHLALVELAALGKLDDEARKHYIEIVNWQFEDSERNEDVVLKSLSILGTLDYHRKDAQEELIFESRYWVGKLTKSRRFRAGYETMKKIEEKIVKELGPDSLFRKVTKEYGRKQS